MDDEQRTPLIPRPESLATVVGGDVAPGGAELGDHHDQFCRLVGVRPVNHPHDAEHRPHPQSLYIRARDRRKGQSCTYMFTASLVNTLLLTQVVLGAALTGLGASNSSRVLITVFGALNTVIAGVVAFLKSRGQPMRARMFRDDLSRVVDEIENSAVMWYGVSQGAHGYGAIDTDDQVTVRGEVARLTRLYDRAVKNNTMNDPDMYNANGPGDSFSAGLRKGGGGGGVGAMAVPQPVGPAINTAVAPVGFPAAAGQPPTAPAADPDDSPASKAPEPTKPKAESSSDKGSAKVEADKAAAASPAAAPAPAPEDAEPASDTKPAPKAAAAAAAPPSTDAAAAPTPTTPVQDAEAPKADAGSKTFAAAAASAAPPPPPPAPVHANAGFASDPDESPASSAAPPKREVSSKTLVETN